MKKRLWLALVRCVFQGLLATFRWMPWRMTQALGDGLGDLAWRATPRYRNIADKNLLIAFGDALSEAERRTLIRRTFRSFGRATTEFFRAPTLTRAALWERVKSDVDMEPARALLARGRGLLVVTAHFGHWELLARRSIVKEVSLLVVARESEDKKLNQLVDGLRGEGGYRVHPRGTSPRALLKQLRANGVVAILPDQKSEDIFVPFFGRLAGTTAGPAVLALKTGAPILPMFCPRQPDGTYRVEFGAEIDTTPTGDADADTHRIMTDVNRAIEDVIRRYPEQWLWLHDRWRVPPPARYREDGPLSAFGTFPPEDGEKGQRQNAVAASHRTDDSGQEAEPDGYQPFSPSSGGKVPKADRGISAGGTGTSS